MCLFFYLYYYINMPVMQIRTRRRRIKKISRRQRSVSRRRSSSRNGGSRHNPSQFNRSPQSRQSRQSRQANTRYIKQTHRASMQNEEQYANLANEANKIVNESPQIKDMLLRKFTFSDGVKSDDFTPQQVLGMLPLTLSPKLNVKLLLYMIILIVLQGADARQLRTKVPTPAIDKWLDSLGGPRIDTTGKIWDFLSQQWKPDPKFRATGVEFNPAGYLQPAQHTHANASEK